MADRARRERGTVLILMPAAVGVVLVLAAIAVDLSIVHLGEREASAAASAAVNDAATHGLDTAHFYATGRYRLDPERVEQVILAALSSHEQSGSGLRLAGAPRLYDSDGDGSPDSVAITVETRVGYIFGGAIPGAPDGARVQASASATAIRP